jgi:hypothetical protein
MEKDQYMAQAISWVESKPSSSIKANSEGYESPKSFTNKMTDEVVQPDLSYESQGGARHYTEIALKNERPQQLVTRWKLLSVLASMKRGKLHLLAPKGHKLFTKRLVDRYNINALVYSI